MLKKLINAILRPFGLVNKEDPNDRYRKFGAKIGRNVRIYGTIDKVNPHLIEIGDSSVIGAASALLTHCPIHGPRPVKVGSEVWIGYNVLVLPGVTIGDQCIIGAGAIMTKSVPPRSIVVGNPARVLRSLTDEEAESLAHRLRNRIPIGADENAPFERKPV